MLTTETIKSRQMTAPGDLAVSLEEMKQQVNWPIDDSSADAKLSVIIERATAEFERDTGWCLIERDYRIDLNKFTELRFAERPVKSLEIKYYNDSGNEVTLASSNYSIDFARNQFRFGRNFLSPIIADRWDAVSYTYTAGISDETGAIPQEFKQPILLLAGYYLENPDMLVSDAAFQRKPYEALVAKLMRSSYP
jgi:uncharacterized phiE125 gp8 family phage protein